MMQQQGVPLRNSGASTADWIGQVKGRVIYAYDLVALLAEGSKEAHFGREDSEQALRTVSKQ